VVAIKTENGFEFTLVLKQKEENDM